MTKQFKINPDLTCPELAGYRLPPCSRGQEDGVEIPQSFGNSYQNYAFGEGYKSGYTKAREKYEFSRQDLIDLVESLKDYTAESHNILGHDEREPSEFVDIFLNGRKRTPIAIEVEMVVKDGFIMQLPPCKHCLVPATNPDGTVKGRWVYE